MTLLIWSTMSGMKAAISATDPIATATNTRPVAGPRRIPCLAIHWTAGSIANVMKSATTSMMISPCSARAIESTR